MKTTDFLKDPFYVPILLQIERRIVAADRAAQAQGISLTDSQVRSVVHKVAKAAEGKAPKIEVSSPREKILSDLFESIMGAWDLLQVSDSAGHTGPLPAKNWILALKTVEDSIRLRTGASGSRNYLEFLAGFLPASA